MKFGGGEDVTVACEGLPAGVAVEVRDRGAGIPLEEQERVFEEFVQLEGGGTSGTGLGLPISRRLAELLGGSLTLRSAPGEGSTFRLELPMEPPASLIPAADAGGTPPAADG